MALTRVQLLGDLRVTAGGREITGFKSRKVAELLAYLAFNRERICTRDELAFVLWPDECESAVWANRLSNALSHIRQLVEPPGVAKGAVLEANRFSARFRPEGIDVDALDFKAAIRAGGGPSGLQAKIERATRAFHLYRGDFCPVLDGDWVFAERVRLQDTYATLLGELCKLWEEAGEIGTAIDYGSRLVQTDAYSEQAHAEIIRLYLAAGRESAARDQLVLLREVLKELDATPSPETLALFESVSTLGVQTKAFRAGEIAIAQPGSEPNSVEAAQGRRPSLPILITRFFGRQAEISQAADLLLSQDARLVTLIGTGGSGKTRLAIEIARRISNDLDGRVFFAGLADVTDPGLIADVILSALGTTRNSLVPAIEQIGSELSGLDVCLLVLDNLEHLFEESVPIIQTLLNRAPNLKLIATSRRYLNLSGEKEIHVPPLPLPDPALDPSAMIENPCVALFVDRAQSVCAEFHLAARNAAAIANLCRRLDGIPLAIELAAAWAKTLTPQQMLGQLSRRFDFLVTRRRDVPIRHQKMLAIIETSCMQLDPDVRRFFAKLCVFQGGWTLDSAIEVCSEPSALEFLRELLERSLLTSRVVDNEGNPSMRYDMLETIKEFNSTQLDRESIDQLRQAHAEYYLNHSRNGNDEGLFCALPEFVSDVENYRAAIKWFKIHSRGDEGLELIFRTREGWTALGLHEETRGYVESLASAENACEDLTAKGRYLRLRVKFWLEERLTDGLLPILEESVLLFKKMGDAYGAASALLNTCYWHSLCSSDSNLKPLYEEAFAFALESKSAVLLTKCNEHYGYYLGQIGEMDSARTYLREAIQSSDSYPGMARPCIHLAELELREKNLAAAEGYAEEALRRINRTTDMPAAPTLYNVFATVAIGRAEYQLAHKHLIVGLQIAKRAGDRFCAGAILARMGVLASLLGDDREALIFFSAAECACGWKFAEDDLTEPESFVDPEDVAGRLGTRNAQKAIAAGASMDMTTALRYGFEWNPDFSEKETQPRGEFEPSARS